MPWKNEIDRMVNRAIIDAARGNEKDGARAGRILEALVGLAPERAETHFHLGTADEILADVAEGFEPSEGPGSRWRFLGQLESAARRGARDRVRELMDHEFFDDTLDHPEGRVALRAVGRLMLRDGEDERAFAAYVRHLGAVDDEGSRKDAEFLLEEALRRADRYDRGERLVDEARERLARAGAFAEAAGLDARAGAKVDRKLGRLHQLEEDWDEAVVCYRRALDRLPEDDPYRSVLVGDLALATLAVRGTLDLLPTPEREGREEAIRILEEEGAGSEGRSYNAIYTLGILYYEQGDYEHAATCLREADTLMRENRAKARIVHARARFFLGHCDLMNGAEGDELEAAVRAIRKDASAANLDPEIKDPIFDALAEAEPEASLPARRGRGRRERGERTERGEGRGEPAARGGASDRSVDTLVAAREALDTDPHKTLELVDKAFRSRPDFDTWFAAYCTRIEALAALNERDEALRTYERFRAKLYQRETYDRIETILTEASGPVRDLFDDGLRLQELVDLYEVMPEREEQFIESCIACAQVHAEAGGDENLSRALNLLREAATRDPESVAQALKKAEAAAKKAGLAVEVPDEAESSEWVQELEEKPYVLVVGGDEGRRPHLENFQNLAKRVGFSGEWIFTGSRPPAKTFAAIEDSAQTADAILIHHGTAPDVRAQVRKLAAEMEIPLREAPWMGVQGVQAEVLRTLTDAFEEV
jgi:tetratricopeptide (TPR) repeat protein